MTEKAQQPLMYHYNTLHEGSPEIVKLSRNIKIWVEKDKLCGQLTRQVLEKLTNKNLVLSVAEKNCQSDTVMWKDVTKADSLTVRVNSTPFTGSYNHILENLCALVSFAQTLSIIYLSTIRAPDFIHTMGFKELLGDF